MTPSDQRIRPADSPQTLRSWFWKAAAIACAALCVFASGLFATYFEDEYAYISQSYYADLFFAGRFNDRAWLEFPRLRPATASQVSDRVVASIGPTADAGSAGCA